MPTPHPWRALRALAETTLHWAPHLPPNIRAVTDGRDIWMRPGMSQVERRCTLAHELEHRKRGHSSCQSAAVEASVEHHAARWLLPDPHIIADALIWARCHVGETADVLWVTERTLRARLDPRHLHPAERAIIERALARIEGMT